MGIHDGHRERVFQKFTKNGFAGLEMHEKLEIILFFSVPRINTNNIAHELLDRYKSISAVMDAPYAELIQFKGITNRTVQLFRMIKETSAIYNLEKSNTGSVMTTSEEYGTHFQLYYGAISDETFSVMSLDSRGRKIDIDIIGKGGVGSVVASPRELLKVALDRKATEVVICHNHPGGLVEPSEADKEATVTIKQLLSTIGVRLKDHIIVTRDDYFSMASSVECNYIFKEQQKAGKK